eukprot:m.190796 g.190796  ORF g.190796 m.190796 type:complete len:500 (+) comp18573_c0_seq1:262-1761(+)
MDALLRAADADSGEEDDEFDSVFSGDGEEESHIDTQSPASGFLGPAQPTASNILGDDTPTGKTTDVKAVVDDEALAVKITEFFPQKDKMCYRIESKTTLPQFTKQSPFTVIRRYEDFQWLHDRLTENKNNAGVVIPHLPAKVTWISPEPGQIAQKVTYNDTLNVCRARWCGYPSERHVYIAAPTDAHAPGPRVPRPPPRTVRAQRIQVLTCSPMHLQVRLMDQFQRRAHQLYRFLRRISRHTVLREDIHVVVFLEYNEDIRPINRKSWFYSPWFTQGKGTDTDDEGRRLRQFTSKYVKRLEKVVPASVEMSECSRDLASAEVNIMHELKQWRGDRDLVSVFRHFSTGLVRSQINHHLQAQVEENLHDVLEDQHGTALATINTLDRCSSLALAVTSAHKQRDKLTSTMPPVGDPRADAQRNKTAKAAELFVTDKQALDDTNALKQKEFKIARVRRVNDFKDALLQLAEHEIHQGQQRLSMWSGILEAVSRIVETQDEPHS